MWPWNRISTLESPFAVCVHENNGNVPETVVRTLADVHYRHGVVRFPPPTPHPLSSPFQIKIRGRGSGGGGLTIRFSFANIKGKFWCENEIPKNQGGVFIMEWRDGRCVGGVGVGSYNNVLVWVQPCNSFEHIVCMCEVRRGRWHGCHTERPKKCWTEKRSIWKGQLNTSQHQKYHTFQQNKIACCRIMMRVTRFSMHFLQKRLDLWVFIWNTLKFNTIMGYISHV